MTDIDQFEYSPITERAPLEWPGGARVAFYVGLNVEHFHVDAPSTSLVDLTTELVPDPLNYGWRDYGARVGFWRLLEIFDRHGVRPSVLLNSEVAERYPQIVAAGRERDWAWLAHGRTNSVMHSGFERDAERRELTEIVDTIEAATGTRPQGHTGPEFLQLVKDQFDQLYADAATGGGRVMALALHPFVIGQAFRARYLDEALAYVAGHDGVWLTTSDEIASHYAASRG